MHGLLFPVVALSIRILKFINDHKTSQEFLVCVWRAVLSIVKIQNKKESVIVPWCSPVLSLSLCGLGGLQHFAILLKYVIHVAIPDIPGWVAEEMAKLEYRQREAFKVSLYHSLKDLWPTLGLLLYLISTYIPLCLPWSVSVHCPKMYTSAAFSWETCVCWTVCVLFHISATLSEGMSFKDHMS